MKMSKKLCSLLNNFALQAILCYWVSTNAVSLCQVTLLKIPAIRSSLKIDPIRKFTPEQLPIKKKKFMESLKECMREKNFTPIFFLRS